MFASLYALGTLIVDQFKSRRRLEAENLFLRHQLNVAVPAGVSDGACFNFTLIPRHDPPTRIELRVLVA